ncbi:hypothetical protein C1Y40_05530 [Mycobacterium talmoniae]|uniref:Uncharacterized protein n=1 Tax=Mycobacterium talmoniae TaxID=1858794 RepID=A0A2S8BCC2_9MYCO|nr:hypothetical protein C1Y40_05530 [Mycobacterium talmoniae]
MIQPRHRVGSVGDQLDEPASFQACQRPVIAESAQDLPIQQLPDGQHLDRLQFLRGKGAQPKLEQVVEFAVGVQRSAKLPAVLGVDQDPALPTGAQQSPQQQQIARGAVVEFGDQAGLDGVAEHGAGKFPGLLSGERLDAQVEQQPLFQQRRHRVGHRLGRPDRHDQSGAAAGSEPVHQHGRQRVQQLGVVNHQNQVGFLSQGVVRGRQHHGGFMGHLDVHRARERPQRHRAPGFGAQHKPHRPPAGLEGVGKGASQRRFADPAVADQRHAATVVAVVQGGQRLMEYVVARDDGPAGPRVGGICLHPTPKSAGRRVSVAVYARVQGKCAKCAAARVADYLSFGRLLREVVP